MTSCVQAKADFCIEIHGLVGYNIIVHKILAFCARKTETNSRGNAYGTTCSLLGAKLTMLVSTMRFSDIVDILIVAYLIYNIIMLIRKTNSFRLARGILLILIALWLSGVLKLTMFNRLLQKTVELGLIALVIIFQPELRRLLERMGSKTFPSFGSKPLETLGMDNVISQTIAACTQLSSTKTGALIVFERGVTLDEQMRSGTTVNSDVTAELLKNIFYPKAPLHDGAVVIRDGRIAAAGCVLPLTSRRESQPQISVRATVRASA